MLIPVMKPRFSLLLIGLLLATVLPAHAQWITQTITLKPGWNAVFLHVDASYTNLDTLLPDANGPVADVWLWQPALSTLQYISSPAEPNTISSQWAVWTSARGDTDTLTRLRANGAYLVNNRTATSYVWNLKGLAVPPSYQWTTTGLNFLGFPTPAASAPNFSTYLKPAPGLDLALSPGNFSHVFRYPGGPLGATNPVEILPAAAASTFVNRGEAFWIGGNTNSASAYYNTYYGPVEVRLQSTAGIDYSDILGSYSVRLRNVTSASRTAVLTLVTSEAAPTGQPAIAAAPQLLVRGALSPITLQYAFSVLGSSGTSFALAPAGQVGSEVQVVLGLNRQAMTLPPGSLYGAILRVTATDGLQQVDVPVTATVPTAAGLWVGQAAVDRVGQYLKSYPAVDSTATNQAAQVNAAAAAAGALPNGVESPGAQWLLREANAAPVSNAVRNPSFEANSITTWPGYGPITSWAPSFANSSSGLNPIYDGSSPFADNGRTPDGRQVAFLQSDMTLSQTLSNVVVGQTYRVHYYENARTTNVDVKSTPTCRVTVGGGSEETQLTGTVLGYLHGHESGSHGLASAFDGDPKTYVDADDDVNADDNWVGLDCARGYLLTAVAYQPRSGKESRMVNGKIQGANTANFSDAVDLLVITAPPLAALTRVNLAAPTAYRYVRYLSPDHGQGNIAELQFFGRDPAVTTTEVVALHRVLPVGSNGDFSKPYYEVYSDPFVALSTNLQLTFTKGHVAVDETSSPLFNLVFNVVAAGTLTLDGTGYGQLPAGNYFNGGSYTIESWVNLNRMVPGGRLAAFSESSIEYVAMVINPNGDASGNMYPLARINQIFEGEVQSSQSWNFNEWTHFASVFDLSTSSLKVYLNGVLVGTKSGVPAPGSAVTSSNLIGANFPMASIANLRIWNTALTPNQLTAAMVTGAYPAGTSGLKAQFQFTDTGTVTKDSSGNGYDMTLVGGIRTSHVNPSNAALPGGWTLTTPYPFTGSWAYNSASNTWQTTAATNSTPAALPSVALKGDLIGLGLSGYPGILREYWSNITGTYNTNGLTNLTSNANYPGRPSGSHLLGSFEAPANWADNYGTRMRGYITAPQTGSYVFWISSDDGSQLWLSTNDAPANITLVAYNQSWSASREWNKYPTQKSVPINLIAGQRYYIEALQYESGGGDNLAVGWARPGEDVTAPSEVVPGSVLSPWLPPSNAFDGNANTFFSGPDASGDWIGWDFGVGASHRITSLGFTPHSGFAVRMAGGRFQGANQPDFSDATTLYTIPTVPPDFGTNVTAAVTQALGFRYVRYIGPDNGYSDVAELQFYGVPALTNYDSYLSTLDVTNSKYGRVQVSLTHRWNFATNDAGALEYSLNGSPFAVVPASYFTKGGPNVAMPAAAPTALRGMSVWAGASPVGTPPPYTNSTAVLGYFNAGDKVRVRLHASSDATLAGASIPNWEIASLTLTNIGTQAPDDTLLLDNVSLVPPQIKSYIAVASSVDGYNLVTADTGGGTNGGLLYVSGDGGNSWTGRAVSNRWVGVACSQDGGVIAATVNNGPIYVSTDFGITWNVRATNLGPQAWSGLALSADGLQMAAVANGGRLYTSANAGQTWVTNITTLRSWSGVALSADGATLLAATSPGQLYISHDSGTTWVAKGDSSYWAAVSTSANGNNLAAAVSGGQIYISADGGQSWSARAAVNYWTALAYSQDGQRIVAAANPGQIYTSDDSGATWTNRFDTRAWSGLAASGDGRHVVAVAGGTGAGGNLYTLNRDFITYVVNPDNGLVTDNRGSYLVSGVKTNLAAVGRPFPLRLILHNPAAGNDPKLFQRVFVGLDRGSNIVVANRESLLDASQLASARRVSATHLPFTTNNLYWTSGGTFNPGSTLGFQVNLSYKDQASNPYLHTFHPDHDNLDVNFKTVLPAGVESYDINRALKLSFSTAGTNFESLTASAFNRGGAYEETMVVAGGGKNTRTFRYTGSFNLQRISSVTNLVIDTR